MKRVEQFVGGLLATTNASGDAYQTKIKDRVMMLDNPVEKKKNKRSKGHDPPGRRPHKLTARERKGFFRLPRKLKHADFTGLHELWCGYVADLLSDTPSPETRAAKLVKADLHGAIVEVVRSRQVELVGRGGIVLKETMNTFQVISTRNRLVTLPKAQTVFRVRLPAHLGEDALVYGSQFTVRSADRSARKFKARPSVEL